MKIFKHINMCVFYMIFNNIYVYAYACIDIKKRAENKVG